MSRSVRFASVLLLMVMSISGDGTVTDSSFMVFSPGAFCNGFMHRSGVEWLFCCRCQETTSKG
ncbi:hypothetical protein [Escherichia coli]|uniref:hypothetical protein n=1 Tax=Escherichia coli TaxID=562 RepID=UPI001593FE2D|nr:hypothetical protein [Escherichia coli]